MCFVRTSQAQHSLESQVIVSFVILRGQRAAATYPSEYCNILPFFDHAIQLSPGPRLSLLFRIRIVFGASAVGGLETLQTRKSPSEVCVANISDFCLDDDACHARLTIGEGAREVVKVCKIVKEGCKATTRIDPFRYLALCKQPRLNLNLLYLPDGIYLTIRSRR